ncbi:MAG TPA: hypothetical protein VF014_07390, partial [Casimicrobiaceae bacterium]|nr:hypothetical protein [Casimicrobiaceae bacterium]
SIRQILASRGDKTPAETIAPKTSDHHSKARRIAIAPDPTSMACNRCASGLRSFLFFAQVDAAAPRNRFYQLAPRPSSSSAF